MTCWRTGSPGGGTNSDVYDSIILLCSRKASSIRFISVGKYSLPLRLMHILLLWLQRRLRDLWYEQAAQENDLCQESD